MTDNDDILLTIVEENVNLTVENTTVTLAPTEIQTVVVTVHDGIQGQPGPNGNPGVVTYVDDHNTTQPLATPYAPDGTNVVHGDRVLFTNLSSGNNKAYLATVISGVISWSVVVMGQSDTGVPVAGDSFYVVGGTAYGKKLLYYNNNAWYNYGTQFERALTFNAPILRSGDTISIPVASGSTNGYLSSGDWTTFNSKQAALGFTPENVANKDTDGTLAANSDTKYPSQKAVKTYADTKQSALGFTPENVANKDTDGTLTANSDTKYPSQKAVKTYAESLANKDTDGTLAANSDTKYPSQRAVKTYADTKEPAIGAGTSSQYYRGDKTMQTLQTSAVRVSNNTSATTYYADHQIDHIWSAGVTHGGSITDNGNGTVNLDAAVVVLRTAVVVSSITRTGTTATVTTVTPHGIVSGDPVRIHGADQADYNVSGSVVVTGSSTFTYQVVNSPTTPATGALIRALPEIAPITTQDVPAVTNQALTDHAVNYIYVDNTTGTAAYGVTTAFTDVMGLARVLVYWVAREGNTLWILDYRHYNADFINKSQTRDTITEQFKATPDTALISAVGTRSIYVTNGRFFLGVNEYLSPIFDTSGSGSFTTAYTSNSGSTWTYTAGQTQLGNTQYNAIGSGLSSISVGNYGVYWIYVMLNNPASLMVLYGQGEYTKSQAFASQEPTVKPIVLQAGVLIGRVIIKQGASSFTDIYSVNDQYFVNRAPDLDSLSDVSASSPNLNDMLTWNGAVWAPAPGATVSAGAGVDFYNATPSIIGTGTNNSNPLLTLSRTPVTTTEQTPTTALASNTVLSSAWLYGTAIGRATIDAGTWVFTHFAGVNSVAGGRVTTLSRYVYQVVPSSTSGYTVTTTGSGTSRTATSSGAIFVAGDASATITVGGYLQTPQGVYKITGYTSSTVVTIATPSTYANESAVAFNRWVNLFGATSPTITSISPTHQKLEFSVTEPAFTVAATDFLGVITFGTSNNTTTLTTVYNGTTHNSFVNSPLAVLHADLAGLQGGTGGQYYHLTSDEYQGTGVGTGNVARLNSPQFTTPNIGSATGNVSGSAASFTGSLSGDVTGTQSATAISAATVTGKLLTGFSSGSGTVAGTDTILQGINKLDGNIALKMPLAGGTFTGWVSSTYTGTASTPGLLIAGAPYTAGSTTTNKPQLLIEPTGTTSTAWNASGTMLGVNAASGFTGLLFDCQLSGVTKAYITTGGTISGNALQSGQVLTAANNTTLQVGLTRSYSNAGTTAVALANNTHTQSSGTNIAVSILPTYNQTSTAAATDLLINRTQTAVGSGAQNLIDAQVGGVSKFKVDNTGAITGTSFSGTAATVTTNANLTGAVTSSGNATTLVEVITGCIKTGANDTFCLDESAAFGYTINTLIIKTVSGTCTAKLTIGGVDVTGISAVSVSSVQATGTASAANVVSTGGRVALVISGNSSATDITFTVKYTRTT